jgi:hypothetical protein
MKIAHLMASAAKHCADSVSTPYFGLEKTDIYSTISHNRAIDAVTH